MSKEPTPLEVVRLKTSAWSDRNGTHVRKSLLAQKRKSTGFQVFEEECLQIGADLAILRITNLISCKDGIYKIVICDVKKDWETGYVDDYNFKLIPFT